MSSAVMIFSTPFSNPYTNIQRVKHFIKMSKENTCTVCEIGLSTEEKELGFEFGNFTYVIAVVYFAYNQSFIMYINTRRPCYVSEKALYM